MRDSSIKKRLDELLNEAIARKLTPSGEVSMMGAELKELRHTAMHEGSDFTPEPLAVVDKPHVPDTPPLHDRLKRHFLCQCLTQFLEGAVANGSIRSFEFQSAEWREETIPAAPTCRLELLINGSLAFSISGEEKELWKHMMHLIIAELL